MIRIAPASATELPEAASVLADAFRDDPVLGALVAPSPDRAARLAAFFEATLRSGTHATGVVDVARRDDDDAIVGVAAWEAPHRGGGALRRVLELPRFLRALGTRGPAAPVIDHRLTQARPRRSHWYLAQIGIAATARGLGVGGHLLATRLARIDAECSDAWLESSTPANRRLYARHGFQERGEVPVLRGVRPMGMLRPA